jgi:DNA-binding CsgD family transcriptional regulator
VLVIGLNQLTYQEQKIVNLVAQGLTNKEIAQRLGSSPFTVRNQVKVIMRKLELKNRVQVAYLSGQQTNIKPEPVGGWGLVIPFQNASAWATSQLAQADAL